MSSEKANTNRVTDRGGVTSTSHSLLQRLKDNQSDGWNRLYTLYEPLVRYWCRRMNVPEPELPDLVQDVFHSVARGIHKFEKTKSTDTFRGWLRIITRNRVIDWYRQNELRRSAAGGTAAQVKMGQQPFPQLAEMADDESGQEDRLADQLFLRALRLIRAHFQENTWMAFWRVVIDGESAADVAADLSMKPGAVRVAKSRVLHRLRAELGELDESQ